MPNVLCFSLHAPPSFVPLFALCLTLQEMETGGIWLQEICLLVGHAIGAVGKAVRFQTFSMGGDGGELAPLTGYTKLRSGSQER
jgi:hypothetical protein